MRNRFEIVRVEVRPLDAPLLAPFTIASSRVDSVENVAIAVHLAGGAVGWGEAPTLPPVTVEDQSMALSTARSAAEWLPGRDAGGWRSIAAELNERLPERASVRAGIEMALFDALARQAGMPLYQWFGGHGRELVTDITIPICANDEAERLAAEYRARGFATIKVKIGLDTGDDIARLTAIRRGHPDCRLVMDANEGYTADQALAVLAALRHAGIEPALLEQPVPREDWDGLGRLAREAGVPVAADEACRNPAEALRIVRGSLAQVINIKLAKCGVVQALEIAALTRTAGIGLMIGGMVETRLAMGFSAHFAAGVGGFDWIDLDTPLLLADDPIVGGPKVEGASYRLEPEVPGHGGALAA
ncbi:dipeptide epimerase [Methylolobus aquaticus]|nr:dipeptide epimerase [Methylolobus aquaticus]